jgi:aryl-alcohol dehydrogenase-like predicted oxidoreductase
VQSSAREKQLSRAYEELHAALSAILYEEDPLGAGSSVNSPTDEYDGEAARLAASLHQTDGDVRTALDRVFSQDPEALFTDRLPVRVDVLEDEGVGCIVFSPLAQGVLTDKYLERVPEGSRASRDGSLSPRTLTEETIAKVRALNEIAKGRSQTLAQMALAWTLRDARVMSALVGASSVAQLEANVGALDRSDFTDDELDEIDRYATESDINIWAASSSV